MNKLKELYIKNRTNLIAAVSILLFVAAAINIYFVVEVNVISNDECLWVPRNEATDSSYIEFQFVKVGGVTWNAGIRDGDHLLKINGKDIKTIYQAQAILNQVESGEYAVYKVLRDGEVLTANVYIKKLVFIGQLAGALTSMFWLIIGFIALMAKPDGRVQKLFYAIGATSVMMFTYLWLTNTNYFPNTLSLVLSYLNALIALTGLVSLPFIVIYFFWTFPKRFGFIEKKLVRVLFISLPVLLWLIGITISTANFFFGAAFNLGLFVQLFNLLLALAFCIAFLSLIVNYKRLKLHEEKKPIIIILVAMTIGMAASIYTAFIAPSISDIVFNSPEFYTPIILVILVPLAFAYSIFKYQLMDVSVVIRSTIIYGAATLTVAAIYFIVIYVLGQSISSAIGTEYQGIIAGIFFVAFALVFQSTKNKFQDFLTSKFYPEQFAQQRILMRLAKDIPSTVGLENILDSLKQTFVEELNIKKFGILIRDYESGELKLARAVGLSDCHIKVPRSNLIQFLKQKALISKYPVVEQEDFAEVFPEQKNKLISEDIYTIVPMVVKSKLVGLMLFGLKHSGSQFAGKDLELLTSTANQAAVAIENARLYESEAEKLKLERDLDLARKIQQSLLPKKVPIVKGLDISGEMIPAMQVGGDYYDVIPVSGTKLFVTVGDVSGKGLSASLYMTRLQTMIQLACKNSTSPKQILVEVNKRMYESFERSWFVTMTLALFDLQKNTVTFCRAGHMPILSACNGTVNSFRTQGLGVGLEKGLIFEETLIEERVQLEKGQIYAFFSDGITEAMNEMNDLFGEDKLRELIKNREHSNSRQIINEIWESIYTFRGTAEQNDDMTMVVVKVN